MNLRDPNLTNLELVASILDRLCEELVLVGGCAVGLLISDPASPPVRETVDVDLVAEVTTVTEHYKMMDRLRETGFSEASNQDNMCRWVKGQLTLDVMPSHDVLGHSRNSWYPEVIATADPVNLQSGRKILVVSPPIFIATKLEAFQGRGKGDYGTSHDLEDIINVVDGRPELLKEVRSAPARAFEYIREEIDRLLADQTFVDSIPMHLRADAVSQARASTIIERLRHLAGL